jgi:hypothetical protein
VKGLFTNGIYGYTMDYHGIPQIGNVNGGMETTGFCAVFLDKAKCDQEISRDIKIIKAIKAQDFRNIHVYIIIILCMYIYMYIYIIIIIVIIIVIIILTFYDIFIAYVHQGIT